MKFPLILVITFVAALNSGCQTTSLDVGAARQIQAKFKATTPGVRSLSFVAPPRTVADITAILNQYVPDPAELEKKRQIVNSQPKAGLTKAELAHFFFYRAQAAGSLGQIQRQLADAEKAIALAKEEPVGIPISKLVRVLVHAATDFGQLRRVVDLSRQRVDASSSGQTGSELAALANLAIALARVGNVSEARKHLEAAGALMFDRGFVRSSAREKNLLSYEYLLLRAEFHIAKSEGRSKDTAEYARALIESNKKRLVSEEIRQFQEDNYIGGDTIDRSLIGGYQVFSGVLLLDGKPIEAEAAIRSALLHSLKKFGRYSAPAAISTLGLAQVIYEQGRYKEAETLADIAIDALRRIGAGKGSVSLAKALALKAQVLARRQNFLEALSIFNSARALLSDDEGLRLRTVESNPFYGALLLSQGQPKLAAIIFERLVNVNKAQFGDKNYRTAEAKGFLGSALAKVGSRKLALSKFSSAIPILLQSSRKINDEASRTDRQRRLKQILESYLNLLATFRPGEIPGLNPTEESFRIADSARSQNVQRALAESSARANISDPGLAKLVRGEQDARKQIAALFGTLTNLLSGPPGESSVSGIRQLREQLDKLRDARAAMRGEIERRFPKYASLINPRPPTLAEVRSYLTPGEALITAYVGSKQSFVWAVPKTGPVAFAAVPVSQKLMAETVFNLRKSLDPNAALLGDIPAFNVALSSKLYNDLLKPVEAGFAGANSLIVVPHDVLGQLPFAVLVTEPVQLVAEREGEALFSAYKKVPFLVQKASITQLPSVASLGTLKALPPAPPNRRAFIAFGDPWFSAGQMSEAKTEAAAQQVAQLTTRGIQTRGIKLVRRNAPTTGNVDNAELASLPRLPDTADEVKAIAQALNADASDVFLGAAANEKMVKTMDLSNRRVVMFATHGLIPGDLNGLTQPALALSAPSVADIDGDGLLTLDEVLALKLNADWVVLSACNTATGDGAGAEAVSGLGRAFFYAGTRALLVTNWPVETTSARTLTTDLFSRQAQNSSLTRAEALRQAMVALLDGPGYIDPDSRVTVFSYAHPIFWAPFTLVGDGGGGKPAS